MSDKDEDIVEHNDILSYPLKSGKSNGASRGNLGPSKLQTPMKKSHGRKKRSARKSLLEDIRKVQDVCGNVVEAPIKGNLEYHGSEVEDAETTPKRRRVTRRKVKNLSDEDNDLPGVENAVKVMKVEHQLARKTAEEGDTLAETIQQVEVKLVDEVTTPSKATTKGISLDHDFTSPLKKVIISNLQEYKDSASTNLLKLSRNFKPTPLPTNKGKYKSNSEKAVSSFFDTFEGYLDQRKSVRGSKKSKNTMSMATEVTREEFALISNIFHRHLHQHARRNLYEIQKKMFPQYWLELTQGFSLLFYGIGSKREFLEKYAFDYLVPNLAYSQMDKDVAENPEHDLDLNDYNIPCIVINGYNPTCNYRDVFKDISAALLPEELTRNETKYWGNHVLLHIQKMIEIYKNEPPDIKVVIIVHNLDGPSLRKDTFQTMLSYLSLIRQVALLASTDHIYAPILWDNFKAQNFNFVFHDITNYEPFAFESSFRDVMKMSKNDSASGAEGAKYVLESLTVNSKKMYKLLVETQLSNMEKQTSNAKGKVALTKRGVPNMGIEFKQLLHSCAAEFIASNELSLRSMLTEFVEHKMATISKNPAGTEHVWIPYNYGEMTKLLDTALKEI